MTEAPGEDPAQLLRAEIAALREEHDQLEAALPPHGLKPGHFARLEELEEQIQEKQKQLEALTD